MRTVALLLGLVACLRSAEDDPAMRFDLVRDEAVVATLRVPLAGGTVAQQVEGVGRISIRCPAPITASDGVVIYREVAIELVEPGDGVALTTSLSTSFARGGQRKQIASSPRGTFVISFPGE